MRKIRLRTTMSHASTISRCTSLCQTRGWRLALGLMGNHADAEDVIQQSLLVVSRKPEAVPLFNPWPWLAKVITFEARNARRRRATHSALPLSGSGAVGDQGDGGRSALQDPKSEDPVEAMLRSELRQRLWQAFQSLSPSQREVLGLVCLSGMSHRAAAKALDMPPGTLRVVLNEGLERLRKELGLASGRAIQMALLALPLAGFSGLAGSAAAGGGAKALTLTSGTLIMKKYAIAAAALVLLVGVVTVTWLGGEGGGQQPAKPEATGTGAPESAQRNRSGGDANGTGNGGDESGGGRKTGDGAGDSAAPKAANGARGDVKEEVPVKVEQPVEAPAAGPDDPSAFALALSGFVRTPGGDPVGGARVEVGLIPAGSDRDGEFVNVIAVHTVTTPDGAYSLRIPGARDGDDVNVVVSHASYAPVATFLKAREGAMTRDFTLGWTGQVSGVVVHDADGSPIAGATVELEYLEGKDRDTVFRGRAAMDGAFSIGGLAHGMYAVSAYGKALSSRVNASVEGLPRPVQKASKMVRLREGANSSADNELRLAAFATLSFRLKPPAGGTVFVALGKGSDGFVQSYGHWGVPLDASEDGVYRADWLKGEHRTVSIKASGYAQTSVRISPRDGEDLDIGVIDLETGRTLAGRVVDENGRPVAGAELELEVDVELPFQPPPGTRAKQPKGTATSQSDGSFVMQAVSPGSYEIISRHAEQGMVRQKVSVPMANDPRPVTIVMPRAGVVFGTLPPSPAGGAVEATDALANTVFMVSGEEFRVRNALTMNPGFLRFLAMGSAVKAGVNDDGSYEVTGVTPGVYLAIGNRHGAYACKSMVTVVAGGRTRVDFDWQEDTGVISGRVTDDAGGPVDGLKVYLSRNPRAVSMGGGGQNIETVTDASGNYSFTGILAGRAVVYHARDPRPMPDALMAERTVDLAPRGIATLNIVTASSRIVLRGTASIDGTLIPTRIAAVPKGGSSSARVSGEIDANGRFTVALPTAGIWVAVLELVEQRNDGPSFGGTRPPRVTAFAVGVEVPEAGLETGLHVTSGSLTGVVKGPNGEPLAGARLTATLAAHPGMAVTTVTTGADGRYEIAMLQAGELAVTASHAEYVAVTKAATVSKGSELEFQFTGASGTIEIAIADITGIAPGQTSWTYVTVTVYADDGAAGGETPANPKPAATSRAPWRPGYNGVTKIASMPPGQYRVVLSGPVEEAVHSVTVAAGAPVRIEPVLAKKTE